MIGRSGAKVEVLETVVYKFGGKNPKEQGRYCEILQPPAAPQILKIYDNGYYMERLIDIHDRSPKELVGAILKLLATYVWPRPSVVSAEEMRDWRKSVETFSDQAVPGLNGSLVYDLYEEDCFRLTHGDPTFANLMQRKDGNYALIDPVPPRPTAPPVIEMDIARLVQSLYGWEHALESSAWPDVKDGPDLAQQMIDFFPGKSTPRIWFWSAYNCGRIIYNNADAASVLWAQEALPKFLEKLDEVCL